MRQQWTCSFRFTCCTLFSIWLLHQAIHIWCLFMRSACVIWIVAKQKSGVNGLRGAGEKRTRWLLKILHSESPEAMSVTTNWLCIKQTKHIGLQAEKYIRTNNNSGCRHWSMAHRQRTLKMVFCNVYIASYERAAVSNGAATSVDKSKRKVNTEQKRKKYKKKNNNKTRAVK